MNEKVKSIKDKIESLGTDSVGYLAIVRHLYRKTRKTEDGLYYDDLNPMLTCIMPPARNGELPALCGASWVLSSADFYLFEDNCRKAVEVCLSVLNKSIEQVNEYREKAGQEPYKPVTMDDYLVEICKVRYTKKVWFV